MQELAPGNTLGTSRHFSVTTTPQVFTDRVNTLEKSDFWSFTLGGRSSFNLNLDGLSADADVQLIRDINGNSLVETNEVIAYSSLGGTNTESIGTVLDAGKYYIRVYPYGNVETDYRLTTWITPQDNAGNTQSTARNISIGSTSSTYSDWVSSSDTNDFYRFNLSTKSNFNLQLSGMSGDADVQLLSANGTILASSANGGNLNESINNLPLVEGTYYVRVYPFQGETFYNLSLSATPTEAAQSNVFNGVKPVPTSADTASNSNFAPPIPTSAPEPQSAVASPRILKGTLRADTFSYQSGFSRTVISGNGNVDFGSGGRDLLDLSTIFSNQVSLNYANAPTGGVLYNSGNGTRIFDAIKLNDGSEILFENIETIKFADTTINLSVIPNDPMFNQQWSLHMMGVQNAWRFTTGSTNVLIGIEDTGLGTNGSGQTHPDLRSTNSFANNFVDESSGISHGNLTQGIIGAASNNGQGTSGINWNSDLMHIDVVGGDVGDYSLVDATQALINQANSKGQRLVVNMSFAGGYTTAFEQLVASNQDKALFVIASGNGDTSTISSPADLAKKYANVMAIGASWGAKDWNGNPKTPGERISYPGWWGANHGEGLTLMGPSEVPTTTATRNSSGTFDFSYGQFTGTSASTPNVSGVASLVWSANTSLTATQIRAILSETAYDLGATGYDTAYGHGFVNADAAVRRAKAIAMGAA
jgi:serine protease